MCIGCLKKNLSSIETYGNEVNDYLTSITCECCRSFPSFLLSVNDDLKILCLTKMKRQEQVCLNVILRLTSFEGMVKERIKYKLNKALEKIDDSSHEITSQSYLNKMNNLADLNHMVVVLDEADHR